MHCGCLKNKKPSKYTQTVFKYKYIQYIINSPVCKNDGDGFVRISFSFLYNYGANLDITFGFKSTF